MRVYHYIAETGEFAGWGEAEPDPLENPTGDPTGAFLVPAYATTEKPPTLVKGNVVVFREGRWGYLLPDAPDGELSDVPLIPPEPADMAAFLEAKPKPVIPATDNTDISVKLTPETEPTDDEPPPAAE